MGRWIFWKMPHREIFIMCPFIMRVILLAKEGVMRVGQASCLLLLCDWCPRTGDRLESGSGGKVVFPSSSPDLSEWVYLQESMFYNARHAVTGILESSGILDVSLPVRCPLIALEVSVRQGFHIICLLSCLSCALVLRKVILLLPFP